MKIIVPNIPMPLSEFECTHITSFFLCLVYYLGCYTNISHYPMSLHVITSTYVLHRLLRWKQDNDPAFVNFLQKKRGAARHTLESLMLLPVI